MFSFRGNSIHDPINRARLRALVACSTFAVGLLIARDSTSIASAPLFLTAFAVACASAMLRTKVAGPMLAFATLVFGVGFGVMRWHETSDDNRLFGTTPGSIVSVHARVLSDPERSDNGWFFRAQMIAVQTSAGLSDSSGSLMIRIASPTAPHVHAGELARITGVFDRVNAPRNPGEIDRRYRAAEDGVVGTLTLNVPSLIQSSPSSDLYSHLLRVRAELKSRADSVITNISGSPADSQRLALLSALFTGERRGDHREVQRAFLDTGLAHALSISGFHIAVLAALLAGLLTFVGERGMPMFALLVCVLVGYVAIVVPSAPVWRSVIMVLAVGCVEWTGRRYDRITVLIWIALLLLISHPSDLWNLGYQLSVGLTLLLMWCGEAAKARMFGSELKGLKPRPLTLWDLAKGATTTAIATSVLCATASMPLILHHTGRITPLATLASVIVSPFIVVLLVAGYVALLVGMCIPSLAHALSAPVGMIADLTLWSTNLFDSIPGSVLVAPSLSWLWVIAATVVVIVLLTRRVRLARALIAVGIVGIWSLFGVADAARLSDDVVLRVDTLDVGSGTCMVVRSGEESMMFDCGSMRHTDARAIVNACRALGVTELPVVIISHPDADHFKFLPQVIDSIPVGTVGVCERFLDQPEAGAAAECANTLSSRGIPLRVLRAGDSFKLGELQVTVLSPEAGADFHNDNDHSLVLEFNHPDLDRPALVLTGDIQDEAIELVARRIRGSPIVIEAPHHGSARAASIKWIDALHPDVVVQSTDASRLNDSRWTDVTRRSNWFSTANSGALGIELTRSAHVRVTSETSEP